MPRVHQSRKAARRFVRSAVALSLTAGLGLLAGCMGGLTQAPQAPQPAWADAGQFQPTTLPAGVDPEQAALTLEQIPGDPPAPAAGEPGSVDEPPRQVLRAIQHAQLLYAEQDYEGAIQAIESVRGYNVRVPRLHRIVATASLALKDIERASTAALQGLEMQPDDIACWYVVARLADEGPDALAAWRIVLKCPVSGSDAEYLTLARHHLGLLLEQSGYFRSARDLLALAETDLRQAEAPGPAHPELAVIAKARRVAALRALARAAAAIRDEATAADALTAAVARSPDDAELRVEHIQALMRAQRYTQGIEAAREHLVRSEGSLPAVELLLGVYRFAGEPDGGLQAIQELVVQQPDKPELAILFSEVLMTRGQFDLAVATLEQLVARQPDLAEAHWRLVALHRFQGRWPGWLGALANVLVGRPADLPKINEELAKLPAAQARQAVNEALSRPFGGPSIVPADWPAATHGAALAWCVARLADQVTRLDAAEKLLLKALEYQANYPPAVLGLGDLYVRQARWADGLAVLKAAPEGQAWTGLWNRLLGQCYAGLDRGSEAARCYQAAIKADPQDLNGMMMLGELLDRMGMRDPAAEQYRHVIAADPTHIEAREALIRNLWSRWGAPEKLKQLVAEVAALQKAAPNDPASVRCTALVQFLVRHPPDVAGYVKVLGQLAAAYPNDRKTRQMLAGAYFINRQYEAALTELEAVLKEDPSDWDANDLKSLALLRLLRIDAAGEQLTASLKLHPRRESLVRNLAEVRLAQGRFAEAIGLWRQLLEFELPAERQTAYRMRAVGAYRQGRQFDEGLALVQGWLNEADDAGRPALRALLLSLEAAAGHHDQYAARCREWMAADAADDQLRYWLLGIGQSLPVIAGGGLAKNGRAEEAVALAAAWMTERPDNPVCADLLVLALQAAGRHPEAVAVIRDTLASPEAQDKRMAYLQGLVEACLQAGRYDEAVRRAKEMSAAAGQLDNAGLTFAIDRLVADVLIQAGRNSDAVGQLANLLQQQEQYESQLEAALKKAPDTARQMLIRGEQERSRERRADLLRSFAYLYQRQQRRDMSLECLRGALSLAPADPAVNNDLGYLLAEHGQELEAAGHMVRLAVAEVLWQGVGEDDRQPAYIDSLGWVEYQRGHFEQAVFWLALAVRLDGGGDPTIYDHLGDAQWRLGLRKEAQSSWRAARALLPRKDKPQAEATDVELAAALDAKLEAAGGGQRPPVATMPADVGKAGTPADVGEPVS